MRRYKRRLPHWDIVEQPLFVTFRLHGSLPANRVFPPAGLVSAGNAFAAVDRLLDASANGPLFLRRPEIAEMVVAALRHGDCALHRYQLHSFVVMPNHVHLLATPHVLATKWAPSKVSPLTKPIFSWELVDHFGRRKASTVWSDPIRSSTVSDRKSTRLNSSHL